MCKGLEVVENKAAFLELGVVGDGVMESGLCPRVMGSHVKCVSRGCIRLVPHHPVLGPGRLPLQISAVCGFNMLMLAGNVSK